MRITVYAGSATGNNRVVVSAAERFARDLARAGHGIVYGGGAVGLMGVLADAALSENGEVIGVVPKSLADAEIGHAGLTDLHVVSTMHERKDLMAKLGDCFVAFPGGLGTLEELFEVWVRLVLGHHKKPVTVFDPVGYWAPLMSMLDQMTETAFLRSNERRSLAAVTSVEDLLRVVDTWQPPAPRWT